LSRIANIFGSANQHRQVQETIKRLYAQGHNHCSVTFSPDGKLISTFIKHRIDSIKQEFEPDDWREDWPKYWSGEGEIHLLVQRAGGLFIFAATVCLWVEEDKGFAKSRLDLVLQHSSSTLEPEKD
jgi:hypothetical protein